jgi:DNA polymerase (family X)
MINDKIVQIFSEIADMLEVLGENVFRVRAYRRAAEAIRGLGYDLKVLHESSDESIENISGIGKDLHAKIVEISETGKCEMHERLVGRLSPGILQILRVRGIGPKKVKLFYEQLEIDSIPKLHSAAESGALAGLPGMGEKSENKIIESLAQMTHEQRRIPLKVAEKAAAAYVKYMKKCEGVAKIEVAGSVRRKKETIGDVDILVTGKDAEAMSEWFLDYGKVKQVLAAGETKSSVVIEGDVQVDFRVVEPESFGAALFYFTGPKHFNIDVRTAAMKKGWKINEYGVFDGEEKIAGKTEKEIFKKLGMGYLPPKERS